MLSTGAINCIFKIELKSIKCPHNLLNIKLISYDSFHLLILLYFWGKGFSVISEVQQIPGGNKKPRILIQLDSQW